MACSVHARAESIAKQIAVRLDAGTAHSGGNRSTHWRSTGTGSADSEFRTPAGIPAVAPFRIVQPPVIPPAAATATRTGYSRPTGMRTTTESPSRVHVIGLPTSHLLWLWSEFGCRDVFRLHRVERGQPRPGDLVVGYPLRDSALGKPGNSHHLGPAAHDLDDIGSVHG